MRVIELLQRRRMVLAALAGLAIGGLVGGAWPPAPVEAAAMSDPQVALPTRQQLARYQEADFARLRDGRLWQGSGSSQSGSAKLSGWRLLGVLAGSAQTAFVQIDRGNDVQQVVAGEALPDGSPLLAVTTSGIEFERGGCRFQRALYAAQDVAIASPGCEAAPAAPISSGP